MGENTFNWFKMWRSVLSCIIKIMYDCATSSALHVSHTMNNDWIAKFRGNLQSCWVLYDDLTFVNDSTRNIEISNSRWEITCLWSNCNHWKSSISSSWSKRWTQFINDFLYRCLKLKIGEYSEQNPGSIAPTRRNCLSSPLWCKIGKYVPGEVRLGTKGVEELLRKLFLNILV